jgi:SAM-dependent methyltransferase
MRDHVRAYYDRFADHEWERLTRPADGALEFALTLRALEQYLPTGARVLDIGGGPGRYTLWLAERGHRVTLADLSPRLLAMARDMVAASPVAALVDDVTMADACDLSRWADASFDAVLSFGPFYHLPDPADRERAARELARVLRAGGIAFVALMPRYAFLRRTLALADERRHLAAPEFVARLLHDGVFENDVPGRFTGGYGVRPEEVAPFFARHGFTARDLLATESIVPDLQEALAALAADDLVAYRATLDVIVRLAGDPSILGLANHLLYVGQKS